MIEPDEPNSLARIAALPIWRGKPQIEPLIGGLSNATFLVRDNGEKFVARVGHDYPFHHVSRDREVIISKAAHRAGFSRELIFDAAGLMVFRFLEGREFTAADAKANIPRLARLLKRFHEEMPQYLTGAAHIFWVFHIVRDYANTLRQHSKNALVARLPELLDINDELESAQMALRVTFGHNDLLPANIIDDGHQLWLIDFEYCGFGTAMFDLAGLSSNSGFDDREAGALLNEYFGRQPSGDVLMSHAAMQCASLLREALWSLVSEIYLAAPGADYGAYAEQVFAKFDASLARYSELYGRKRR